MPKAVTIVSPEQLAERRRLGMDRFDEMWEGVVHMVLPPELDHQEFAGELAGVLRALLDTRARVAPDVARAATRADLVVEIRSEDDETWNKLPFYAARQVEELLVLEADRRELVLLALASGGYERVPADGEGWLASRTGLFFRWDPVARTLTVRAAGQSPVAVRWPASE